MDARDFHLVVYAVAHALEDAEKLEVTVQSLYEESVEINRGAA